MKSLIKEIYHTINFIILMKAGNFFARLHERIECRLLPFLEYRIIAYFDKKADKHYTPRLEAEAEAVLLEQAKRREEAAKTLQTKNPTNEKKQ